MMDINMRRLILLPLLTTPIGGCILTNGCTLAACSGSYALSFEADNWADGEYNLFVAFDGMEAQNRTFTLPLGDNEALSISPVTLENGVLTLSVGTPMDESLVEADIQLIQEEAVLFSDVVEPVWDEPYWPNGEDCDPGQGCLSAWDTFRL